MWNVATKYLLLVLICGRLQRVIICQSEARGKVGIPPIFQFFIRETEFLKRDYRLLTVVTKSWSVVGNEVLMVLLVEIQQPLSCDRI